MSSTCTASLSSSDEGMCQCSNGGAGCEMAGRGITSSSSHVAIKVETDSSACLSVCDLVLRL